MDSIDKIINDMEDEIIQSKASEDVYYEHESIKSYYRGRRDVTLNYLTRLKALRDLTDKQEEDDQP